MRCSVAAILLVSLSTSIWARPAAAQASRGDAAVDEAATQRLVSEYGREFAPHHSSHFSIVSNARGGAIDPLRDSAESTFVDIRAFSHRLQVRTEPLRFKLMIVFFEEWSQFQAAAKKAGLAASESLPGFFDPKSNTCYAFNFSNTGLMQAKREALRQLKDDFRAAEAKGAPNNDPERSARKARLEEIARSAREIDDQVKLINRTVIRHEIAHQVLHNLGLEPSGHSHRRWLIEGLAMQFEAPPPANPYRINDILSEDWQRDPVPLNALIADPGRLAPHAERLPQAYALAWAVVHVLIEQKPREFRTFLENPPVVRSGGDSRMAELAAFESAFGPVNAAMERRIQEHVRKFGIQKP